jgi:hypothetical protein
MKDSSYQHTSHAVGGKASGGVPLQPVTTKVHSSSQRGAAAKSKGGVKLTPPKK